MGKKESRKTMKIKDDWRYWIRREINSFYCCTIPDKFKIGDSLPDNIVYASDQRGENSYFADYLNELVQDNSIERLENMLKNLRKSME